ncbi:MAG: peptidyl-prolyl cis-trans isomerase [Burkholderiaceae bacterium]
MRALPTTTGLLLALALAQGCAAAPLPDAAPAAHAPAPAAQAAPFAIVGDSVISAEQYRHALALAVRNKYYHAKPPQGEFEQFQRDVGDELVNRTLLLHEARRRGLQPEGDKVAAALARYDVQYQSSSTWQANRERMLGAVRPQLESDSLLEQLAAQVKRVAEPDEGVARAYYEQHLDLFIEPEQVKLSVILLKVDPSSAQAVWNAAHAEAGRLHKKLLGGADFSGLARLHSADRSAGEGGQMDYTHRGMLPEALHAVLDKLRPRELSEPVQVLQGVLLVRLDDRRAAQQRSFEQARQRAATLWQRDESQARWTRLIAQLRSATPIRIDPSHYAPLPPSTHKARAG